MQFLAFARMFDNFLASYTAFFFTCADCVQQITESEGEIVTPYHDTVYPNKLNCAWTISLDAEHKDLEFKFTAFDLEESIDCTADYVVIRDGKDETYPLIGKKRITHNFSP